MISILLKYIGQYKKATILTPVYSALQVFMEVLIPFVTGALVDKGIQAQSMPDILLYGSLMLLLALASLFFGVMAAKTAATASTGFAFNLRKAMYETIQTFSFSNIDKFSTAGLVTRMTTDVTNLQNAFQMCLRIAVRAPLTLVSSMVMCFFISPSISSIFLVAVLALGVALMLIVRHVSKIFTQVFRRYDDLNTSVQENVSAIRVVKAFVREDHENEKFEAAAGWLYKLSVKAEAFIALNAPVMMMIVYGCMIALSWFGAHQVVGGILTTGQLTSLFTYIMNVMMSLMMLSMIFVMLTMSLASGRRISEVLTEEPGITNPEAPLNAVKDGSIDFNHVSFAYKQGTGESVLKDIDLHIQAGETIGVIGSTGCGKSTLVSLISRLYDVTDGSVCVGGEDVRRYDLQVLRDNVAVVLQKNVLFSGTVMENLRWGKEDATEEECREACRLACADDFISALPEGYQAPVEQGGNNFSGGQKQRLCIARALLKQPRVLVLDDSTSAVDTATDARIRQSFARKIPGTTRIIIAQRISSVMDADRIIVMDDGAVAAFDTHSRLMQNCEIYREIYETQTQGGGDFDQPGMGGVEQ